MFLAFALDDPFQPSDERLNEPSHQPDSLAFGYPSPAKSYPHIAY